MITLMAMKIHTSIVNVVICVLVVFSLSPETAWAQQAKNGTSPFEALRWNNDAPEVMVQGTWYQPVAIHGVNVDEILTFLAKVQPGRVQKRFGEDLPDYMRRMGHTVPAQVDLSLIRLEDGEPVELTGIAMTRENRQAIWRSNQGAQDRNRGQRRRTVAPQISREHALADIAEFQKRLDDQFAYRHLKNVQLDAELDELRSTLKAKVEVKELAKQLHQLMMQFGDGHAGARSSFDDRPSQYPPCLLADTANGVVAFRPNRSGLIDADRPYVLAIDGMPIDKLLDAGRPWIVDGSEQLIRTRTLRNLRNVETPRAHLGMPERDHVTYTLATGPFDTDPVDVQLPMSRNRPTYGDWPRRESGVIDGNIGYLRINRMDDRLVPNIQSAMQAFEDTEGLIVDVRGNGGGTRLPLRVLAGYLTGPDETPWVGNVARYRLSTQFRPNHLEARYMYAQDSPHWSEAQRGAIDELAPNFKPEWDHAEGFSDWHYLVLGRTDSAGEYFYDKPVVVLADADCFSATDIFLGALSGRPRVTLMGSPSGGGSARSQGFSLSNSGIEVRCASMASFRPDGRLYDGRGVEVDVEVAPEPEYFIEGGDDAVLNAALKHLRSLQGS